MAANSTIVAPPPFHSHPSHIMEDHYQQQHHHHHHHGFPSLSFPRSVLISSTESPIVRSPMGSPLPLSLSTSSTPRTSLGTLHLDVDLDPLDLESLSLPTAKSATAKKQQCTLGPSSPTSVTDLSQLLDSCLRRSGLVEKGSLHPSVVNEAVNILRGNDNGGYTIPARGLYPYQWNWDSALVAMGWGEVDTERAWDEMHTLMSAQWSDGMVPHVVFHKHSPTYFPGPEIWGSTELPRGSTGITQPPVAAIAVQRLLTGAPAGKRALAEVHARQLFPKLLAYHRWFYAARDPEGSGLVATLHPWESGMDNSPAWDPPLQNVPVDNIPAYTRCDLGHVDAAMRPKKEEYDRYLTLVYRFKALDYDMNQLYGASPFRVTDLCTNAVLHRANRELRQLAVELEAGEEVVAEIDGWLTKGQQAFAGLWDEDARLFKSRDQLTGEVLPAATSAGFLPLYAGVATAQQAEMMVGTLTKWMDAVQYGVPSLDPLSEQFEPLRYWRGPVWVIVNYMITDGLRQYGYHDLADRIEANTCELVNNHGIYEYYNPTNGDGAGGSFFSWTAAMCLAWLEKA